MKSKSLVINPLENSLSFQDNDILLKEDQDLIKWSISCVCASERRRFNKQKSHSDLTSFIAGHESVGRIKDKKHSYVLLPHSNCITRSEKILCSSCASGAYNLCKCMNHAGLASSEPGGLSEYSSVPSSQLLEVRDLDPDLAVFTEPLSCVIRSWKKTSECSKKRIGIFGLGPIGCLHFLYGKILFPESEFYVYELQPERVKMFNSAFKDYDYCINHDRNDLDFSIMANSVASGFESCKNSLSKEGSILLFSGFNEVNYKVNGLFPEFIHREEFNFYDDGIFLFGSSGYQMEDLQQSVKTLKEDNNFLKIITGKVFGLESKELIGVYTDNETFKDSVLIEDISGNLNHHIKIQYHVNNSE